MGTKCRRFSVINSVLPSMSICDIRNVICSVFCYFGGNVLLFVQTCTMTIVTDIPREFMGMVSVARAKLDADLVSGYQKQRKTVLFRQKSENDVHVVDDYHIGSVTKLLLKKLKTEPVRYMSVKYDKMTKWLRSLPMNDDMFVCSNGKALPPRSNQCHNEKKNPDRQLLELYPLSGQNYDKPDSRTNIDMPAQSHVFQRSRDDDVKHSVQISHESIAQDQLSLGSNGPAIGSAGSSWWAKRRFQNSVNHRNQDEVTSNPNQNFGSTNDYQSPSHAAQVRRSKHPTYEQEASRLASFKHWPLPHIQNPAILASKGFFYTETGDLVRCFSCGLGLRNWENGDDPVDEHRRHNSDCTFLTETLNSKAKKEKQFDTKENGRNNDLGSSKFQRNDSQPARNNYREKSSSFGLSFSPRHPSYTPTAVRVSSFSKWPKWSTHPPQVLADAGFFYTGIEDIVRCFACDGGMRRWEPEDEPWFEHARYFPRCPYLIEEKGSDFVQNVQRQINSITDTLQKPSQTTYTEVGSLVNAIQEMTTEDREGGLEDKEENKRGIMESDAVKRVMEMGYSKDVIAGVLGQLRGAVTSQNIVNAILERRPTIIASDNGQFWEDSNINEADNLVSENLRLRSLVKCVLCKTNERNILALPCTHHKMCTQCAEGRLNCPECGRQMKQKIRTYMS